MDTKKLTKSAAIKAAAGTVSIHGSRTSWVVLGPYYLDNPSGPSTESHHDTYTKAVRARKIWTAGIILSLMGKLTDDAWWAMQRANDDGMSTMRELLAPALPRVKNIG